MNIPIYRAKRVDRDGYVEGFYIEDYGVASYIQESKYLNFIVSDRGEKGMEVDTLFQIDPTTLAIHFPDMIDSQGNKIFVSLQEDRKGGDILIEDGKYEDGFNPIFEPYFRKSSLSIFDLPTTPYGEYQLKCYKIIGIQK